jgi:hypothetical protein
MDLIPCHPAMIKAGAPPEAFRYYPTDHAGAGEILRSSGRGMVFGDVSTTKVWANDPRVEVRGPGFSKVILGEDEADNWEQHLDVVAASIADNSGRGVATGSDVDQSAERSDTPVLLTIVRRNIRVQLQYKLV